VGGIRLRHPRVHGVHCWYKVNSTDAVIEQPGFEPGVQFEQSAVPSSRRMAGARIRPKRAHSVTTRGSLT